MSYEISVIIPVYNGGQCISELYKTLADQTFKNFEVLFIDDGSTDHSSSILRDCQIEYASVIKSRCISQNNQGQGAARNKGIEVAEGKYLVFIDQDDRISEDYLEILWKCITEQDFDVVVSGYREIFRNGKVRKVIPVPDVPWGKFMCIAPWAKIYNKQYLDRFNIRFLPFPIGEDIYFNLSAYTMTNRIGVADFIGYSWVVNENSFSRTVHHEITDRTDILVLFNQLSRTGNFSTWILDPTYQYFLLKTAIYHVLYTTGSNSFSKTIEYNRRIFEWIKINIPGIEKNELISFDKPIGEQRAIRYIVSFYYHMSKLHLENVLLLGLFCLEKIKQSIRG